MVSKLFINYSSTKKISVIVEICINNSKKTFMNYQHFYTINYF